MKRSQRSRFFVLSLVGALASIAATPSTCEVTKPEVTVTFEVGMRDATQVAFRPVYLQSPEINDGAPMLLETQSLYRGPHAPADINAYFVGVVKTDVSISWSYLNEELIPIPRSALVARVHSCRPWEGSDESSFVATFNSRFGIIGVAPDRCEGIGNL